MKHPLRLQRDLVHVAAVTVGVVWLAGRRGDKGNDRSVLHQGVAISSLVDIARIFALTPLTITLTSAIYKAALAYLQNSWTSSYYAHAKKRGLQYIMSMEIACDLAYVALWGALLVVLLASGNSRAFFVVSFVIAAIAAWGCLFIGRQRRLVEE